MDNGELDARPVAMRHLQLAPEEQDRVQTFEQMANGQSRELTTCEIIGDWGPYQWSLVAFSFFYSALAAWGVTVGPMWTPNLSHVCAPLDNSSSIVFDFQSSGPIYQCSLEDGQQVSLAQQSQCSAFVYDDRDYGRVLTNTFDLVCSRRWLRSCLSSSSLAGMLVSSVALGQVSDKFGRLACCRLGIVVSIVASVLGALVDDYLLLNGCFFLISFAQVGVANAIATLVMESTSPRFRYVSTFQYAIGWATGILVVPFLHQLTLDYKLSLMVSVIFQLVLAVWLQFGIFESIRWLLSEGHIHRAQIELQRACRLNRVQNGTKLAQQIARVQVQQVRKASCLIDAKLASLRAASSSGHSTPTGEDTPAGLSIARQLDLLNSAVRSSFALARQSNDSLEPEPDPEQNLSQTLARKSFSVVLQAEQHERNKLPPKVDPVATKTLAQLALKYGKALQQQDEGSFFLIQMFHPKLAKTTIILVFASLVLEVAYYGFIQASSFVGKSITVNYVYGACSDYLSALVFMLLLWALSRRLALIVPMLLTGLICMALVIVYQLLPETGTTQMIHSDDKQIQIDELRHMITVHLMPLGKFTVSVAIQVAATIACEAFPNNLRQTGPAAVLVIGRVGSILSPFLFNDHTPGRFVLKGTLLGLALMSILLTVLIPFFLRDNKGKELSDRLTDIQD